MMYGLLISIFLLAVAFPGSGEADLKWKFKTKGRVYSSPLIEGDQVYFGSGDEYVYALNRRTGESLWRFKTGGAVHSSAAANGKHIYIGSADGHLYAVDKNTGEMIWKFASAGEKTNGLWDYYLSTPVVANDLVYWGSGDGHLYAIDAATGKSKWQYDTGDIVHASAAIDNEKVFIGSFDGHMYALDKNDGSLIWKFDTVGASYFPKGEIQKGALVKDDVVYFGSRDYNIYALDAKTGRGKWNMREPKGWIIATPVEHEGNIYFGTSDAHVFYSMNKDSGELNWSIPLSMRVYGSAVAGDELLFFGTFDGKVLGVDYKTGAIDWQFQTEASKTNYHTIYDKNGKFKEGFELYDADYIAKEGMIHDLGSVLSTPAIADGVIYFGSSDGYLYAVNLP